MVFTVAHMKKSNIHVHNTPEIMLKHDDHEITSLNLKVHGAIQGILYGAIPATTIPGLIKNPSYYGIGVGVGVTLGAIYRLIQEAGCPGPVSYVRNWKDWLGYYAALNNVTKTILGATHGLGLTGATLLGVFTLNGYAIVSEGLAAGAIAGFEGTGYIIHLWTPQPDVDPMEELTGRHEIKPLLVQDV